MSTPPGTPAAPSPPRPAGPGAATLTAVGLVLALIGALTLSAKAIGPPSQPASAPALLGAGARADWGRRPPSRRPPGRLETAIGRKLNIGHSFVPWGAGLGEVPAANVAAGRTPMISFGRAGNPRAVAAGRHDRYLTALARASRHSAGRCCSATAGAWTAPASDGHPLRDRLRGRLAARPRPVRRPGRARLLGVVAERRRLRRRARRRRPVLAGRRLRRLDRRRRLQLGRLQRPLDLAGLRRRSSRPSTPGGRPGPSR